MAASVADDDESCCIAKFEQVPCFARRTHIDLFGRPIVGRANPKNNVKQPVTGRRTA